MSKKLKKLFFSWLLDKYKVHKQKSNNLDIGHCLTVCIKLIQGAKYGFLISHGQDGWCSSRLVQPIFGDDFAIWIGTGPGLRKIKEIKDNPKVTFAIQDSRKGANLILYGNAKAVSDIELRKKYWKPEWKLFFPNGPASDDFMLIYIETVKIELMSFAGNVIPEPFGLKPVVMQRVDGNWRVVSENSESMANA